MKELQREEQLRRMSKRAFQGQQAAAELRRTASEGLLARAGQRATLEVQLTRPNVWRYAKPQRQLRHQAKRKRREELLEEMVFEVMQGDGRPKMLSRVFLNGDRS